MNVAVIPARGGSRRIPRKNIRLFHGKPIIAYSIEAAKESGLFDAILVSTEDAEIAAVAEQYGAEAYGRGMDLTADSVGPNDVVGDLLFKISYAHDRRWDCACCIYATAPLLLPEDLRRGLAALQGHQYAMSISDDRNATLTDAAMFIWGESNAFVRGLPLFDSHTALVPIPKNRVCDINVEEDWLRAEEMYTDLKAAA